MSDPFDDFENRVLALHDSRSTSEAAMSYDEQEFRAFVGSFLGDDYDATKTEAVRVEQSRVQAELATLAMSLREKAPEKFAELANRAIEQSFARIREILGKADFVRLFGSEALKPMTLIDVTALKESLARPHTSEAQGDELAAFKRKVTSKRTLDYLSTFSGTVAAKRSKEQSLMRFKEKVAAKGTGPSVVAAKKKGGEKSGTTKNPYIVTGSGSPKPTKKPTKEA
jgi:hypothetical protein